MTSLDDAAQLLSYSWEIGLGFVVIFVLVAALKGRGSRRRFREHQAQQQALAASMGFRARGAEPGQPFWQNALASIAEGPEALGRFPRFGAYPRVQILLEGERNGFKTTVLLHTIPSEYQGNDTTTLVCFASPELDLPTFTLKPAVTPPPAAVEAVLDIAARALKPLIGSPDPEIAFQGRIFERLYSLRSGFTVRIRDAFRPDVVDFFETHPGWSVEGLDGRLLVYRDDVLETSERMPGFVAEASAVAEAFRRRDRR